MVFRSLVLALLGACLWTLVILVERGEPHWCAVPRVEAHAPRVANPITIIDLAARTTFSSLRDVAELVRLDPDEDIVAVDDHPVVDRPSCAAAPADCTGAMLAGSRHVAGWSRELAAHRYVDFTVANATASRRVLVLLR